MKAKEELRSNRIHVEWTGLEWLVSDLWRFLAKVCDGPDGCLLWIGSLTGNGYGRFSVRRRLVMAHRWIYEVTVGDIPDGLELDHLCRVRQCINPSHLEPVSHRENGLRGIAVEVNTARQRAITHCPHGHEYSPENTTLIGPTRRRRCRACNTKRLRELRARLREAA